MKQQRTLEDDETGKPTVVNGEHLDPYNVPEQLIGDVGLAGPKGEPGKKGVCGEPGPMGKNVSVAKPAAEDLVFSTSAVTRSMLLELFILNVLCLLILHYQLKKRISQMAPSKPQKSAGEEAGDDSYISMSFGIANVNFPSIEEAGHAAAVEDIVKSALAKAAVAGGAPGIVADNAAVAMGEGDENSTLVSATMSPPDGVSVTLLQQALAKGQLQALLPRSLDAAPGVDSFKTGPISVTDFESQIEKPSGGEATGEEEEAGDMMNI